MTKKATIFTIAVAIIICVLVVITCLSYFHQKSSGNIPLLNEYQLKYGSSPSYVKKQLGEALKIIQNVCDTNQAAYEYSAEVLNHKASMTCYFVDDCELIQVDIKWTLDSSDMAKDLCAKAETILIEAYASEDDYFYNSAENYVSLGKNNGATGVFYKITVEENILFISCINNK